jgi:hypothetical protein
MRPQSPADRRIWSVPCRGALPRATNLRAGRSTTGNAAHAEEDQPSRGPRTGCSAPLSCDELAIDPQHIVGRVARARTGYNAASQSLAAASTRDPPFGASVSACRGDVSAAPKGCSVASAGYLFHRCGGLGATPSRGRPGAPVRCGVVLALDVGQALGELAVSDPDNIHAAHVPVRPVVAPAHDGASFGRPRTAPRRKTGPGASPASLPRPGAPRPGLRSGCRRVVARWPRRRCPR